MNEDIKVFTTYDIANVDIQEHIGLVQGSTVRSRKLRTQFLNFEWTSHSWTHCYVGRKEKKNLNNILDYLLNKDIVAPKFIEEFRQWFLIAYETKKKVYYQAKSERDVSSGRVVVSPVMKAKQTKKIKTFPELSADVYRQFDIHNSWEAMS